MFHCKACQAKDKHIADIKSQLDKTHDLLARVIAPNHAYPTAVESQANIILDGAGHEHDPASTDEKEKLSEVEQQAIALLSGTY